ncbi:MAG: hypothetical protein ACK418_19255 [Pseudomonas sp.]|uniref:hypothetical protein n=1 Tax=Pseudomonas sp. TaxID=306 RepID=UPI00391A4911
MSDPSKAQGHVGQKARPDTPKRKDSTRDTGAQRPRHADVDQGGIAPGGPSKDPESGA